MTDQDCVRNVGIIARSALQPHVFNANPTSSLMAMEFVPNAMLTVISADLLVARLAKVASLLPKAFANNAALAVVLAPQKKNATHARIQDVKDVHIRDVTNASLEIHLMRKESVLAVLQVAIFAPSLINATNVLQIGSI